MKGIRSDIWERRSLIWDFAITDLKLRYRNSILGFLWSFLEPLLILAVLYFVFTNIFRGQIEDYPLYLLLGIIMWNMFSRGTTSSLNSLVGRSSLISQIYFPREIMAISSTITVAIMFGFELTVFGIFMAVFEFIPPTTIFLLPFIFVMLFVLTLSMSLLLSILNVYYRDVQFIWGVILQAGFFLTPIFYTLSILPSSIKSIIIINPMALLVDMAHDITLYGIIPSTETITYVTGIISSLFLIGYLIFRRLDKRVVEAL